MANGTGPYGSVGFDAGLGKLELAAFDRYWGKKASEATVCFYDVASERAAAELYQSGIVNAFAFSRDDELLRLLEDVGDVSIMEMPGLEYSGIGINGASPKMTAELRGALYAAMDKDAIVSETYGRGAYVTCLPVPVDFFALKGLRGLSDRRHNARAAERLFASAGYTKDSAGIYRDASGSRLVFRMLAANGAESMRLLSSVEKQLKEAGLAISARTLERSRLWQAANEEDDYDFFLYTWRMGNGMDMALRSRFGVASPNTERWGSEDLERILREIAASADYSAAKSYYQEFLRLYLQDLPQIPIASAKRFIAAHHSIDGFVASAFATPFLNLHELRIRR